MNDTVNIAGPTAGGLLDDIADKQEISVWQRLIRRSLVLLALTAGGFAGLELIALLGSRGWDVAQRFPEIIIFMQTAMLMTWLEVSLIWIRTATMPKVDFQALLNKAAETPLGAAIAAWALVAMWAIRIVLFCYIAGFGTSGKVI